MATGSIQKREKESLGVVQPRYPSKTKTVGQKKKKKRGKEKREKKKQKTKEEREKIKEGGNSVPLWTDSGVGKCNGPNRKEDEKRSFFSKSQVNSIPYSTQV